jgi:hypothetical protein
VAAADWQADIGLNGSRKTGSHVDFRSGRPGRRFAGANGQDAGAVDSLAYHKESATPVARKRKPDNAYFARYGDLLSVPARDTQGCAGGFATCALVPAMRAPGGCGPDDQRCNLRALDLDPWRQLDLMSEVAGQGETGKMPLREASVVFNELRVSNRRLHDTHVRLRPAGNGWRVVVAGREISGEVVTVPAGDKPQRVGEFQAPESARSATREGPVVTTVGRQHWHIAFRALGSERRQLTSMERSRTG